MPPKAAASCPNDTILIDGPVEGLSKRGTFIGQHVLTPLQGCAVQINAFNFPVWGMLEKLGANSARRRARHREARHGDGLRCRSGVPDSDRSESAAGRRVAADRRSNRRSVRSLTGQDVVSFTGSANTAQKLQRHPVIARESVRFIAERDSLNAAVLGPDATPDRPEFELFVKEVVREMTAKAGQKCTAIRRAFVPASLIDATEAALKERWQSCCRRSARREDARWARW